MVRSRQNNKLCKYHFPGWVIVEVSISTSKWVGFAFRAYPPMKRNDSTFQRLNWTTWSDQMGYSVLYIRRFQYEFIFPTVSQWAVAILRDCSIYLPILNPIIIAGLHKDAYARSRVWTVSRRIINRRHRLLNILRPDYFMDRHLRHLLLRIVRSNLNSILDGSNVHFESKVAFDDTTMLFRWHVQLEPSARWTNPLVPSCY